MNTREGHDHRIEMAQCLERGAFQMSLPVVRFQTPLGARFSLGTPPSNALLHSDGKEYLVGQRLKCVQ